MPTAANIKDFAWKISDGDDATPQFDKLSKSRPSNVEREGWKGCWVVRFESGFAPRIVSADGSRPLAEPGVVKRRHYIQALGSVNRAVRCSCGADEHVVTFVNLREGASTRCNACAKAATGRARKPYFKYADVVPDEEHRRRLLNRFAVRAPGGWRAKRYRKG